MSGDRGAYRIDLPKWLGRGTSNETWSTPGSNTVQRWLIGGPVNALDLRLINDTDARGALVDTDPTAYVDAPSLTGEPLDQWSANLRLTPHETDPKSSEVEFDTHVGFLIDELAYVSHNSEAAAHVVAPKARQAIRILTSLPEDQTPLRCAATAGDSAVMRAFTVRVAEVVTPVIGRRLARSFGLPTPSQLQRGLPAPRDDHSSLALAHGDPTVDNFMWSPGEPVLIDWELARPVGKLSSAAHTLAALVTRAPYPLRPDRREQFIDNVAAAREAVDSGLYARYYAYEVARSSFVDVLRGLRGEVDPALVHRNVARFLGDNAPSPRKVEALLRTHADGAYPIPVLPRAAAEHLAERPPKGTHPAELHMEVSALHHEVIDAAAAVLPPEVYQRHRAFLDTVAKALPPARGSVIDVGKRLRDAGMTELSAAEYIDRVTYRFSRPRHPGPVGYQPDTGQAPSLGKRKDLTQGD